jgi:ribosomal protein L10
MSKVVKQMQMDAIKSTLSGVRDLVVLSFKGLNSQTDGLFRANLRKKKVRLQVVKNSYTRRVFKDLGLSIPDDSPYWDGTTMLAWGGSSVSELSRAIDSELKAPKTGPLFRDRVTIKGAIVDGQPMPFKQALEMPTREEAIARVVLLATSPGSRLVSALTGPAAAVASQIKQKSEEKPAEAAPAAS